MVDDFIDKIIEEASKMKDLYNEYAEKKYKYSQFNEIERNVWMKLQDNSI
jgi:hypothetical protein